MSEAAVKQHWYRGRKVLKKLFRPEEGADE